MCGHRSTSSSASLSPSSSSASTASASAASSSPPASRTFIDRNYFRLLGSSSLGPSSAPPSPPAADPDALPSSLFNEGYYARFFHEDRRLGRGQRGTVFLCRHVMQGVPLGAYAVKKVPVGDNASWLVRMLQEVRTLEGLHHRNVVDYKHAWLEYHHPASFGPTVPCLFILMEFANAGSAEDLVLAGGGFLSERAVLNLARDVAHGLAYLHEHGIIHRDVKPSNVLLCIDARGASSSTFAAASAADADAGRLRAVLSDFGEAELVASMAAAGQNRRRTGATGTLDYVAPELLVTDAQGCYRHAPNAATDVWALGMVVYFACFGRLPYANVDDVDVLAEEILSAQWRPLALWTGEAAERREAAGGGRVSGALRAAVEEMLHVGAAQRPRASDIAATLDDILRGKRQEKNDEINTISTIGTIDTIRNIDTITINNNNNDNFISNIRNTIDTIKFKGALKQVLVLLAAVPLLVGCEHAALAAHVLAVIAACALIAGALRVDSLQKAAATWMVMVIAAQWEGEGVCAVGGEPSVAWFAAVAAVVMVARLALDAPEALFGGSLTRTRRDR